MGFIPPLGPEDASVAGGSAQREYDRRAARELARKQQRVDDDAEWRRTLKEERPILGRLVTALSPKPQITPESQSTRAWKTGAEGERRVAEVLAGLEGIETLHDRLMIGSNANIDHIAIAPSGVWVIDAKKYAGRVETRNVGGIFRADLRLYVNGRDRTKLVEGVLGQVDVVKETLGDSFPGIEVRGVLCFINSDWSFIMRPQQVRGVTALWPMKLPEVVAAHGPHGELVPDIAAHLRARLRPGKHS